MLKTEVKRTIGTVLIIVGLLGIGTSLILIACLSQQIIWLAIGSIILLSDGVYVLKQYYFSR